MSEQYLGEIRYFACSFTPANWAMCDGSLLPIAGNDGLYSLIGTTYGGDGNATFGLPDLRGRVPIGTGGGNPIGAATGSETVALATAQLPIHNHMMQASTAAASATDPTGQVFAANTENAIYAVPTAANPVAMSGAMIGMAGQSIPHANTAPTLPLRICICTNGTYPSRP